MAMFTDDPFSSHGAQMMSDRERQLRGYDPWARQQNPFNQSLQGLAQGLGGGFQAGAMPPPPTATAKPKARKDGIRGELQSEVDEWLKDIT